MEGACMNNQICRKLQYYQQEILRLQVENSMNFLSIMQELPFGAYMLLFNYGKVKKNKTICHFKAS